MRVLEVFDELGDEACEDGGVLQSQHEVHGPEELEFFFDRDRVRESGEAVAVVEELDRAVLFLACLHHTSVDPAVEYADSKAFISDLEVTTGLIGCLSKTSLCLLVALSLVVCRASTGVHFLSSRCESAFAVYRKPTLVSRWVWFTGGILDTDLTAAL